METRFWRPGALAQLISMHLDVPRWIFKLDDEFGGRGHAHLDTESLPCHQQLLKEHDASPEDWEDAATQAPVVTRPFCFSPDLRRRSPHLLSPPR